MQSYCARCDDYQELEWRTGLDPESGDWAAWICTICGRDATDDCGFCLSDKAGCRCGD
jgi:hypothetical protein